MAESALIATRRLHIVPFAEEFLTPQYLGWLTDPEVVRFSQQRHYRHTLESCRRYWQSFAGSPHYFWALVARPSDLGHIGTMTAYVDPVNGLADLGVLLGEPAVWGRGYGLEAWQAVINYLFETAGLRKITAGTIAPHQAMLKLMHKAGMHEDGRRLRHYLWEGQEVDVIHLAIFRDTFPQEQP